MLLNSANTLLGGSMSTFVRCPDSRQRIWRRGFVEGFMEGLLDDEMSVASLLLRDSRSLV